MSIFQVMFEGVDKGNWASSLGVRGEWIPAGSDRSDLCTAAFACRSWFFGSIGSKWEFPKIRGI